MKQIDVLAVWESLQHRANGQLGTLVSSQRFKNEIAAADGVLIVTPEHNRSISAVLKNAIDWGTRPYGKNVWADKPGFITGTAPGAIATALVQQHLRSV